MFFLPDIPETAEKREKRQAFTIIGAGVGSYFGPVGTAVGAGIGLAVDIACWFFCSTWVSRHYTVLNTVNITEIASHVIFHDIDGVM